MRAKCKMQAITIRHQELLTTEHYILGGGGTGGGIPGTELGGFGGGGRFDGGAGGREGLEI